jgi:hypothetical protein
LQPSRWPFRDLIQRLELREVGEVAGVVVNEEAGEVAAGEEEESEAGEVEAGEEEESEVGVEVGEVEEREVGGAKR